MANSAIIYLSSSVLLHTVCLSVCLFVRLFFRIAIFVIFIARTRGLGPGKGFTPVCIGGGGWQPLHRN